MGEKNVSGGHKIRGCRSKPGSPLSPRGYNCAALQSTGAPAQGAFHLKFHSGVKCCAWVTAAAVGVSVALQLNG